MRYMKPQTVIFGLTLQNIIRQNLKNGTEGKCIEARELIIALPESFTEYPPDRLLQIFTDHFRQTYGTDCIAALHHNKRKTNYHIHLIFSERTLLEQPIEKVATRNMFYDEKGNHVRTKKEILDEEGNIRKRCKVIHKGEVYERQIFSIKDKHFKAENFLDTVKQDYTNLINQYVWDKSQRLEVFERGGMYLATKKIGKNNPKATEIEADNSKRTLWNQTVDRAIVTGVSKSEIMQIKKGTDNGQDCGIRMALRKQTESVIFHYRYCHCSIRTVNLQSISQNSGACR